MSWVFQILRLVKKKRSVRTYLGDCDDDDISFFRLEPPPVREEFYVSRGEISVENVDAVLRNVEKVELCGFDIAVDAFGTHPSKRHVSLYIEKRLGTFLFA